MVLIVNLPFQRKEREKNHEPFTPFFASCEKKNKIWIETHNQHALCSKAKVARAWFIYSIETEKKRNVFHVKQESPSMALKRSFFLSNIIYLNKLASLVYKGVKHVSYKSCFCPRNKLWSKQFLQSALQSVHDIIIFLIFFFVFFASPYSDDWSKSTIIKKNSKQFDEIIKI